MLYDKNSLTILMCFVPALYWRDHEQYTEWQWKAWDSTRFDLDHCRWMRCNTRWWMWNLWYFRTGARVWTWTIVLATVLITLLNLNDTKLVSDQTAYAHSTLSSSIISQCIGELKILIWSSQIVIGSHWQVLLQFLLWCNVYL